MLRKFTLEPLSMMVMQPGSQAITKHQVLPNRNSSLSEDIRYSISFRHIVPTTEYKTKSEEKTEKTEKTETVLIFGTSISKYLESNKLAGNSNINVLNLSESGNRIHHISNDMDNFFTGKHRYFNSSDAMARDDLHITKVFISVGTNDILRTKSAGISRLYIPLKNLVRKAQLLFNTEVFVQSVIPIPTHDDTIISDVHKVNRMLIDICRSLRCQYMNLLDRFLTRERYVNTNLYRFDRRRNRVDLHLNYAGLSLLGKAYISVIRGGFDPYVSC